MLENALLEIVAVVLDEFARNEDEAGQLRGKPGPQKPQDLRREGVLTLYILNARLSRVGNDKPERRNRRVLLDVRRNVDALDAGNLLNLLDGLAADDATKTSVVLSAAVVQDLRWNTELVADWLNYLDRAVETGIVVHLLDHPVDEAPEEVPLAKL